ncbi:hypothetical protein [Aquabacterium sp.]|uniref:hypothetical protein n=1 Tax=Aquabacterium sp. TaxID=1872578 RepID=UPI0025BCBE1B|nr:hypothetical protein [Aquabacterium sp.]
MSTIDTANIFAFGPGAGCAHPDQGSFRVEGGAGGNTTLASITRLIARSWA